MTLWYKIFSNGFFSGAGFSLLVMAILMWRGYEPNAGYIGLAGLVSTGIALVFRTTGGNKDP